MTDSKVYLVFEEKYVQPSKVELIKGFKSKENAEKFQSTLKNRSYIQEVILED